MSDFHWTAAEVLRALGQDVQADDESVQYGRVSTDTRSISEGDLFVALQGERFDAHDFLDQAAESGATAAVVSHVPASAPESLRYFVVEDTLRALGKLGHHRRRALRARVVAVAGSNGKTTTKEFLRAALGVRYRVHATEGNYNNQVGVPLTLLAAPQDAEILVVELGTNEPGEIEILTRLVEPEAGIVTAVGEEHLEKLVSLEGVLEEELDLLRGLPEGALALVAEQPEVLPEQARSLMGREHVWVAGFGAAADLRPDGGQEGVTVTEDGTTRWSWEGVDLHLPLPGYHNVRNALLALGLARAWGVGPAEAVRGLEGVRAPKMRGEWHRIGTLRVLSDCYNANPPSVRAAVSLLASVPATGAKVAVLGTMREMGESSSAVHRQVAEEISAMLGRGVDRVVATGEFATAFRALGEDPRVLSCDDPLEAYEAARAHLEGSGTVLLKASRGEALERWVPLLERDRGE